MNMHFNVGDNVRVINNSVYLSLPIGATGVVTAVDNHAGIVAVAFLGGSVLAYHMRPSEIEMYEQEFPTPGDAVDWGLVAGHYQPVPDMPSTTEPVDEGLTPDDIMDITRSFCR